MDFHLPLVPDDSLVALRPRRPVALWVILALLGIVLGGASLLAAMSTDTRDFAARHGVVLANRTL